jgi:hypothetical protein
LTIASLAIEEELGRSLVKEYESVLKGQEP